MLPKDMNPQKVYSFYEPSTGGGGMIIAAARVLKERGMNPQRCMDVVAQDLDWKAVHMTYLQLSLLGIKATVVQGNSLTEPYTGRGYPPARVLYTPAKKEC
nr:MAG TPA: type I restriction-modification system methyltransferase [Caudoviricetes sp.]